MEPVCGFHAVGTVFHMKPLAVERLFFDEELSPMMGELCSFLAKERKPYRQTDGEELAKIAGTRNHGGVVAVVRRRPLEEATTKVLEFWGKESLPLMLLDGVSDPGNLGYLARTAAYFGMEKLVLADTREQAMPSELAYRVSRGGLDMMEVRRVSKVLSFLKDARKTHFVIGLDLEGLPLPDLAAICPDESLDKPVALVIGNEEHGLSEATLKECDAVVCIPGSGALDRLHPAAEAALLVQKYLVEAF